MFNVFLLFDYLIDLDESRFYGKSFVLESGNQLPLPVIDYHRTIGCTRLHEAVINYQKAWSVTGYACNRLQVVLAYKKLHFLSLYVEPSFFSSP